MTHHSDTWPALDLRFPAIAGAEVSSQDLALAALDGLALVAIEELGPQDWRVFFRDGIERDAAAVALGSAPGLQVTSTPVDVVDQDWARRSQAALKAVRVGLFIVAPPWDLPPSPAPTDIVLVVEPSMGFGTGHHASTRLCLDALQRLDVEARHVVDIGTGSGVLAMAAARLGAASVTGVDIDADALASAQDNLAANGLASSVVLCEADFRSEPADPADIVLANLTGGMLSRSAPHLLAACRAGGHLIMSGILATEEADVVSAFGDRVSHTWRRTEDEWVGLTVRKNV
jgi:ribosomal protein L11 methyltransferase